MITFGLTGGIASGKSTVARTFIAAGIPMVDADIIARQVVEPGTSGLAQVIETFGHEYLQADGTLDRIKLGKLVFSDPCARFDIDMIMLPLINKESSQQIEKLHADGHYMVGWNAALIFEMGNAEKYRPLILVHCPTDMQIARLMSRNSLTRTEAMNRIEAQMPTAEKLALSDYTIDTSNSIEDSISQTEVIIHKLRAKMYRQKLDSGEITCNQVPYPWRDTAGNDNPDD
jgi:dephospho-CoA kinase